MVGGCGREQSQATGVCWQGIIGQAAKRDFGGAGVYAVERGGDSVRRPGGPERLVQVRQGVETRGQGDGVTRGQGAAAWSEQAAFLECYGVMTM